MADQEAETEATPPTPEGANPPEETLPAREVGADLPNTGFRLIVVMDDTGLFHYATNAPREDVTEAIFAGGLALFRARVLSRRMMNIWGDTIKALTAGRQSKPFTPAGLEHRS